MNHTFILLRGGLRLFDFGHVWACADVDVNIGRGRCPENDGWIIDLLCRRNMGSVVVSPGLFIILISCPLI